MAQQAGESVVDRVGRFNGDEVPKILRAYNAEMTEWGVDEAMRLEYFCRAVAASTHEEVERSFEKLMSRGSPLRKLYWRHTGTRNQRGKVGTKAHRSVMKAFQEFEHRFAQLLQQAQRLVGADKVLLILKMANGEERMNILLELEDDYGAHNLTKDWTEVEWVCRQHDEKQSATTQPPSGGEETVVSAYALLPKESSTRKGSEEFDLEALVREAYKILKMKVEADGGFIMELGPRGSEDAEEDASLCVEDGAYVEAERA